MKGTCWVWYKWGVFSVAYVGDGGDVFRGSPGGPTFHRNHTEHGGPGHYEQSRGLSSAQNQSINQLYNQPVNQSINNNTFKRH